MSDRTRELSQEETAEPNVFVVTELSYSAGRGYIVRAQVWKIEKQTINADIGRETTAETRTCLLLGMAAPGSRAVLCVATRYSAEVLAQLTVPAETLANVRTAALAAHVPGSL